jgi:hypothetical protein
MDTWPLDLAGIVKVFNNASWADLEYSDNASADEVESAQGLRGFHTLEYLIYKDGKARTIH